MPPDDRRPSCPQPQVSGRLEVTAEQSLKGRGDRGALLLRDPPHSNWTQAYAWVDKTYMVSPITSFRISGGQHYVNLVESNVTLRGIKPVALPRGASRNTPHIPPHMFCTLLLRFLFPISTLSLRSYAATIGPKADLHIVNRRVAPDGFTRSYAPHSYTP